MIVENQFSSPNTQYCHLPCLIVDNHLYGHTSDCCTTMFEKDMLSYVVWIVKSPVANLQFVILGYINIIDLTSSINRSLNSILKLSFAERME